MIFRLTIRNGFSENVIIRTFKSDLNQILFAKNFQQLIIFLHCFYNIYIFWPVNTFQHIPKFTKFFNSYFDTETPDISDLLQHIAANGKRLCFLNKYSLLCIKAFISCSPVSNRFSAAEKLL